MQGIFFGRNNFIENSFFEFLGKPIKKFYSFPIKNNFIH